jgi:hypothetical protein
VKKRRAGGGGQGGKRTGGNDSLTIHKCRNNENIYIL